MAHIPVAATSWKQTVLLRFQCGELTDGQLRTLGAIIWRGASADLLPELCLAWPPRGISSQVTFVMLAKKKVKRQCSSEMCQK